MKRIATTVRASGLIGILCLAALPMRAQEPLVTDKPILIPGTLDVFDPVSNTVKEQWFTSPAEKPHAVWTAYGDKETSHILRLSAQ